MNDLAVIEPEVLKHLEKTLPTVAVGLREALGLFARVNSFEEIEHYFLKGAGLADTTYRAYLGAVKEFYGFTEGKHPMQTIPADIEEFYDHLLKRGVARRTARLRIAGLKKFFEGVVRVAPGYTSPFHEKVMDPKLTKKLNKVPRGNTTKTALTIPEFKKLIDWMEEQPGLEAQENRAMVFFLGTSGLRAAELCSLKWKDLDLEEGSWSARFSGKGDKEAVQELYSPAVEAAQAYFKAHLGKAPAREDHLFYSIPRPGQTIRSMTPHLLWTRIAAVGEAAREAGVLTRESIQFTPHLFRRTYATMLYKSGMQLKGIQGKTRHSNTETLTKHYIDDQEKATPYIDKALRAVA